MITIQCRHCISVSMSRLTDHAVGTLDIGYVIRPKQKAIKEQKFVVVKNKRQNTKVPDGNRIQEEDLSYYFIVYSSLVKQKAKFKRYQSEYEKVEAVLCDYRMVITNPKPGENYLQRKSAARKALDSLIGKIDDGKTLHMSVEFAKKKETLWNKKDLAERKIFKDEMQPVMPSLYISGWKPASDNKYLSANKITHIVCCVDATNAERFPNEFKYLVIKADDNVNQNMKQFFSNSNRFIRDALKEGGKILIHCGAGISRSTTILCAFLINEFQMKAKQAIELCKQARPFCKPNDGFIRQLKDYEKCIDNASNDHKKSKSGEVVNELEKMSL